MRRRSGIRVVQDAIGSHPATDQDEKPGRRTGEQTLLEVGTYHCRHYCTLTSTEIRAGKVPAGDSPALSEPTAGYRRKPMNFAIAQNQVRCCGETSPSDRNVGNR